MRIHKFYRKSKYPNDEIKKKKSIEERYVLYAITNQDELAKRFKKERNMKEFVYICDKGMDKEEYAAIANSERGSVLDLYELNTVTKGAPVSENASLVEVLMTYTEHQIISDYQLEIDDEELWLHCMMNPFVLTRKYIDALNILQYIPYYKIMVGLETREEGEPKMKRELQLMLDEIYADDYDAPTLFIDQLAAFVCVFHDIIQIKENA